MVSVSGCKGRDGCLKWTAGMAATEALGGRIIDAQASITCFVQPRHCLVLSLPPAAAGLDEGQDAR